MSRLKKVAGIALITGIIGLVGMFLLRDELFSFDYNEQMTESTEVEADQINEITVQADVADVKFEKSPDQSIHVLLTGRVSSRMKEQLDYQVAHENSQLSITLNQSNQSWFSFIPFQGIKYLNLIVQVPDKPFEKLSFHSNVADAALSYGNFSAMDVTTDVGDIEIENMDTAKATIETNVGDINVEDGLGSWDISSDVGETSLSLAKWEHDVTIESEIGDVEMEIQQMPKAFQVNLTSDIGDVHTSGIQYNQSESNDKDIYLEIGTGGPELEITSDIGDIEVISK